MSQTGVLYPEVVKQYSILVLVSVPPFVTWLVEQRVTVSIPYEFRFTRACGSPDPSVMQISESRVNGSVKLESRYILLELMVLHDGELTRLDHLLRAEGKCQLVEGGSVSLDVLPGLGGFTV